MNKLYFGDNLLVMRNEIASDSVDLVYLDPPFNSKAQYNVFYETPDDEKETAQRTVFRDTWIWGDEAQGAFEDILAGGGPVAAIINALRNSLGRSDTMAYLVMMTVRLQELYRILKPTGSIYLHCDPTAAHYIKIVLDGVFGAQHFRNEVVWKRTGAHGNAKRWGPVHDTIFFYTMSDIYTWNRVLQPYEPGYLAAKYRHKDSRGVFQDVSLTGPGTSKGESGQTWRGFNPTDKGRHWAIPGEIGSDIPDFEALSTANKLDALDRANLLYWPTRGESGFPRVKQYPGKGNPIQDVVTDITALNSQAAERLGFPTQKPVALLDRIISASSNPGEIVLDPFCGCGTTIHSAAQLGRQWIGIDVSYYSVRLIQRRMTPFVPSREIVIGGIPADHRSALALAERDPYGFQQWIVGELGCQLWNDGKKGADRGIDGEMYFFNGPGPAGRLLVQVKGGQNVGPKDIRDFAWVLKREHADMGVFVSRNPPTKEMQGEASEFGRQFGAHQIGSRALSRLQIVDMSSWFAGHRPSLPRPLEMRAITDKSQPRKRARRPDPKQPQFIYVFPNDQQASEIEVLEGNVLNPALLPDSVAVIDRGAKRVRSAQ